MIIIHALAIGACVNYLDEFWQLYLDEIGFTVLFFGLVSALISAARIPGNLIASYLSKFLNEETIILSVLGINAAGFFMTTIFAGWIGISFILIIFLVSGVVDPVVMGYLHHRGSFRNKSYDQIDSIPNRKSDYLHGGDWIRTHLIKSLSH